jgi:hypothetical protein
MEPAAGAAVIALDPCLRRQEADGGYQYALRYRRRLLKNPGKSNLKLQTYITLVTRQQHRPC